MQTFIDEPSQKAGDLPRLAFAVVLTWPELANAEYEVVQRICRAADNIGVLAWVVDNDGYPLWASRTDVELPKRRLTAEDCTFVLSLHFESPRLYDIPSYTALWNPPDFYVGFGYNRVIAQLASHTDVLSCRSTIADAHATTVFTGLDRTLRHPFPPFFHGVPRPYLKPRQDASSRLFYVGVNWERVTGGKGRHHDLLTQLDSEDLISIYGPENIFGIAPWQGFSTYRGSIPFDGESVVARINEAGICLALSSSAHQISGIMSNRLFEALAAGAITIANPHPLITKYFADVVHVIDDRKPAAEMVADIRALITAVRSDPAAARARAERGQQRLAEGFSLEDNLSNLFATHAERLAGFERAMIGTERHEISLVLDVTAISMADADRLVACISAQSSVAIDLLVIGAPEIFGHLQNALGPAVRSARSFPLDVDIVEDGKISRRSAATGGAFAQALAAVQTPFFCVLQASDSWFSDHLATLAHKLSCMPASSFACSGKLEERLDKKGVPRRRFDSLTFEHLEALAEAAYLGDAGRFLFRSTLIAKLPQSVFTLLDTMEPRLLTLWALLEGPPAQTNYASYLHLHDVVADWPMPLFPAIQQQETIRDTVRGRPDWLSLVSMLRQLRPSLPAMPKTIVATLGQTYAIRKDGKGLELLSSGFSLPEEGGIWIDGREGILSFELAETPRRAEIVLCALGRLANKDKAFQRCTIIVNGQSAGQVVVGTRPALFRLPVPATVDLSSRLTVALRMHHADQVFDDAGKVVDDRRLGLQLVSFAMMAASAPVPLFLDHTYSLAHGGDGLDFFVEGFSPPEVGATWVYGPEVSLTFVPERSVEGAELMLIGLGPESKPFSIHLDDLPVGEMAFDSEPRLRTLPLPALHGGRVYRLTVDLQQDGGEPAGIALVQFALRRSAADRAAPARPLTARRVLGAARRRLRHLVSS